MDGTEFFDVAEKVIQLDEGDAYFRTAVSRSYYALFLSIRDDMDYIQWPNAAKAHKKMCTFLRQAEKNGAEEVCGDIAATLGDLRQQRNDADYGSNNNRAEYTFSKEQAQAVLLEAKGTWKDYKRVRGNELKGSVELYLDSIPSGKFEYWNG